MEMLFLKDNHGTHAIGSGLLQVSLEVSFSVSQAPAIRLGEFPSEGQLKLRPGQVAGRGPNRALL